MNLVRESVYNFHKTGDVKSSLGIGDVMGREMQKSLDFWRPFLEKIAENFKNLYDLEYKIKEKIMRNKGETEITLDLWNQKLYRGKKLEIWVASFFNIDNLRSFRPYSIGYGFVIPNSIGIESDDWIYIDEISEANDFMQQRIYPLSKKYFTK